MKPVYSAWLAAALAAGAAQAGEPLARQAPAPVPAVAVGTEPARADLLFPAVADPLSMETLAQDLKQAQIPSFVHIGGGKSAPHKDALRDALALPKSAIRPQADPKPAAIPSKARPAPAKP